MPSRDENQMICAERGKPIKPGEGRYRIESVNVHSECYQAYRRKHPF